MWLPEDQTVALAWQEEQALACPGCGHPRDESTDEANKQAYAATVSVCHACTAKELRMNAIAKAPDVTPMSTAGLFVGARRV